jgi:hypothetical protein
MLVADFGVLEHGVLGGNLRVIPFAKCFATLDWRRIAFLMFVLRALRIADTKKRVRHED